MKTITTERLLAGSVFDQQLALEREAVESGVKRYRDAAASAVERNGGASLKPAERLVEHWFAPLVAEVKKEMRECRAGVPSIGRSVYGPILLALDPEVVAFITIHETLGHCMKNSLGVRTADIVERIGEAIIAEVNMKRLREHDVGARAAKKARLINEEERGIARRLSGWHEHPAERELVAALDRGFRAVTIHQINWWAKRTLADPEVRTRAAAQLGATLVWLLIGVASADDYDKPFKLAFHHKLIPVGRKSVGFIRLDKRVMEIIENGHAARETLRPRYLPMVHAPMPWTKDAQGGYIHIRTPFIVRPRPDQKRALARADLSQVYDCLSAVSATPMRLNCRLLEVMRKYAAGGGGVVSIPPADNRPEIPRPAGYDPSAVHGTRWNAVDKAVRKAWSKEDAQIRHENKRRRSERATFHRILMVADKFEHAPKLWFPHQLDYRGRTYPIPQPLNHQGDDRCRGLLELADGVPPDERWLAIQAANAWGNGVDKLSFDDRVAWVKANAREIERSAGDPEGFEWWHGADKGDKPWQFLAACFALVDPKGAGAHLPVGQDGSCNGLQHYTALSRDEEGARVVNMVPGDKPTDAYSIVAELCRRVVANGDAEVAEYLLPLIDRSVCKPTTMTNTYGVTMVGARKQVRAQLKKKGLTAPRLYPASRYLSQVILDSLGEICKGAKRTMDWLEVGARAIVAKRRPVGWTTPLGLPVVQAHRRLGTVMVKSALQDISLSHDDAKLPLDAAAQIDGVSPNFIHSIDATHNFMTGRACRDAGVAYLAVHDKFVSHAGTSSLLARVLREQFVALHEQPILDRLADEWRLVYGVEIDDPPTSGNYEIEQVQGADYFFG